ncbi:MAG: CoA ligase [Ignavibacteria bacterium]|nr:CoA ligase [Ignavibacteria bacterium]
MFVKELIEPKSIVVVGGSNDIEKPGGKALFNLLSGNHPKELYVVNPKEQVVQGLTCLRSVDELEKADLAIIAIASKYIVETVTILASRKQTKAFIILSAGFSEIGEEGKKLEEQIAGIIENAGGTLIGPNCIGVLTTSYSGIFAGPVPKLDPKGCDFVTGSGATAVFIVENAIQLGLRFSSIFSVGNSARVGVEEVLEYWDESFVEGESSEIKLIYMEKVDKPDKLLRHASSLIRKGCRIAAIKAGTTDAGSRAVSSHTGALAGSDTAIDALFRKAGIIRCYGRADLIYTACVLAHPKLPGKNLAVVTHAGGPGVMATDTLTKEGLKVPKIEGSAATELLGKLYHGSSVGNPIDFLATGTPEQLGIILDYIDTSFDEIDGTVVIFGTPGLYDVTPAYNVLNEKMKQCRKPIYPVLPSPVQAADATEHFKSFGRIAFPDEVLFCKALARASKINQPFDSEDKIKINFEQIREVIANSDNGYIAPIQVGRLLDAAGIPRVQEWTANNKEEVLRLANEIGYPVVMKAVGIVHKSDAGGVALNIKDAEQVENTFQQMMNIERVTGVLIQKMLKPGIELFLGAKKEAGFGHILMCGAGGIFIELINDFATALAPVGIDEANYMLDSLKSKKIFEGVRGLKPINRNVFAELIMQLSALVTATPEISELDINPLIANEDGIIAVDARIKIDKL